MSTRKYEMDMTDGGLVVKILIFSLPLILSGMLQLLFNAADVVVVGRFAGESALAAVGAPGPVINLLTNVFMGLSVGTNVLAARYIGSGKSEQVSDVVHTSVLFSFLCGIALAVIGIAVAKPIMEMMGTPDDVIDQTVIYMRIYFAGMPVVMLYNFCYAIMRAMGDTRRPMYYLVIAGIINVVLNVIFVTVFHMDVAGVALATIISQAISAVLIIRCLCRIEGSCRLDLKRLRIHMPTLGQMVAIGLPAGLQGSLFSISNVLIQSSINLFGKMAMAGNAAAGNLEGFVYISMNSVHQTAQTFISQNYGAAKFDRIKRSFFICLAAVSIIGLGLGNILVAFGQTLLRIYSDSPEVISYGVKRLHYVCTLYFLCGVMEVVVGAIRGLGSSVVPMLVSLAGACGLRILWIYTVFAMNPTLETLYISYPVTWFITVAAQCIVFMIVFGKCKKRAIV